LPTTFGDIQADLIGLTTPREQLLRLAAGLGIGLPDSIVGNSPRAHLPHNSNQIPLRVAVDEALLPLQSANPENLPQLIQTRILFETMMAWEIAANESKRSLAKRNLQQVQHDLRRLAHLSVSSSPTGRVFDQFWDLDGKFHRELCRCSGQSHLAEVVDIVLKRCKDLGVPKCSGDLTATVAEHDAILAAVTAQSPIKDEIRRAVEDHVWNAQRRWFPKEWDLRMTTEIDHLVHQSIIQIRERVGRNSASLEEALATAIRAACEQEGEIISEVTRSLICEDLAIQQLYPEEYVVFYDEFCVVAGQERAIRHVKFHSKDLDKAIRYKSTKLRNDTNILPKLNSNLILT
jgi:DNA-binding FadR family transcriptional regulator